MTIFEKKITYMFETSYEDNVINGQIYFDFDTKEFIGFSATVTLKDTNEQYVLNDTIKEINGKKYNSLHIDFVPIDKFDDISKILSSIYDEFKKNNYI